MKRPHRRIILNGHPVRIRDILIAVIGAPIVWFSIIYAFECVEPLNQFIINLKK